MSFNNHIPSLLVLAAFLFAGCQNSDGDVEWSTQDCSFAITMIETERFIGSAAENRGDVSIEPNGLETETFEERLQKCLDLSDESYISLVREKVSEKLKDPFSAEFERETRSGSEVTGYVNAKNSYGAYTGFKPYKFGLSEEGGVSIVLGE